MRIINDKAAQYGIAILYPLVIFGLLCMRPIPGSWFAFIIVTILFSLLWSSLRYLMISTILLWLTAVPAWWLIIERTQEGQGSAIFTASLPFIILAFLFLVLVPEMLIVLLKNFLITKYVKRSGRT